MKCSSMLNNLSYKNMFLTLVMLFSCGIVSAEQRFFTIGTGGVTGVYYPTGGAICRLVNIDHKEHGFRCSVEATEGSIYNLNMLRAGDLDMAVAQSDWQYHSYHGTSRFSSSGADKKLRSVFSIHAEPFTVLARADAGINHFKDLKGKRVNIGNPGSGQRGTMEVLMQAYGWKFSDFKVVSELKSSEQAKALCDGKVDAIVFVVGHPSGSIQEATSTCATRLIEVTGPEVDLLVKQNSYYRHTEIPVDSYDGNDTPIKTFGVGATFVTSADVSEQMIYTVVKSVFKNFDTLRNQHPSFKSLIKDHMIRDSLSAPLHPGAVRYYQEIGLLR